jgi:hypothetical protein
MRTPDPIPTSALLDGLLREAPQDSVTLGWLVARLGPRSFGLVLLLLGLLAMLPGISTAAGLLLAIPAWQMLRGRAAPVFPDRVAARGLPTRRLATLIRRTVPALRAMERVMRPRFATPFEATKRLVGALVLVLGALLLLTPVPLSGIPYGIGIILVALAYLEQDGVVLCLALATAIVLLGLGGTVLWRAIA